MKKNRAAMFKALLAGTVLLWTTSVALAQNDGEVEAYKRAVAAMNKGEWSRALNMARQAGPVAEDIFTWHRLRSGRGNLASYQRFLAERPDWPGLKLLRRKGESALPLGARADEVIAYFSDHLPQTGRGTIALITALRSEGRAEDAKAEAIRVWRTEALSEADEKSLLSLYATTLKPHHEDRLDMLLWRGAKKGAQRMMPRVDSRWKALATARIALRDRKKGVNALIDKVPASLRTHPGLNFERMQWRARNKLRDDAVALMLDTKADALGEPARWAGWRRSFARTEMRAGRTDRAYKLATQHGLSEGSHFADLEWLAGYLALTYRDDPLAALRHFQRFRGSVATPISLGRAGYWEGRAYEAMNDAENARLAYAFGAEYQTSFYGLLAAENAGLPLHQDLAARGGYLDWSQSSFADSSVFRAAQFFIAAGERNRAEQFLRHMTETLAPGDIGSLGAYVMSVNEPHLAVMIGKQAARRGIVVPSAYYPVASLGLTEYPVPRELALAIARRESEFDPVVTSGAGARGLMQLMPATAKAVAKYLKVPYSRDRLLSEPAYNARLGTAYLDELMEIFDGNIVMVAAGYNAGPGRPIRWMSRLGDPRRAQIDIVDWIEHIPFDETRNYVMRVAESLPVYRARLTGQAEPLAFSAELVAAPGHTRQARIGKFQRPQARPTLLLD